MLLNEIADILMNDVGLTGILSRVDGVPAVFKTWAIDCTTYPYIVLRWDERISPVHWGRVEATLYIDIWDYNETGHIGKAQRISNRIINLLDRKRIKVEGYSAIRINLDTKSIIPMDEPNIVRITQVYTIIAWRRDFIKNLLEVDN